MHLKGTLVTPRFVRQARKAMHVRAMAGNVVPVLGLQPDNIVNLWYGYPTQCLFNETLILHISHPPHALQTRRRRRVVRPHGQGVLAEDQAAGGDAAGRDHESEMSIAFFISRFCSARLKWRRCVFKAGFRSSTAFRFKTSLISMFHEVLRKRSKISPCLFLDQFLFCHSIRSE